MNWLESFQLLVTVALLLFAARLLLGISRKPTPRNR
jgi:hypothetical protein